jgi:hypothetical protein
MVSNQQRQRVNPTTEVLVKAMKRLGAERLREECEHRIPRHFESLDLDIEKAGVTDLAEALAGGLSPEVAGEIAADGLATNRTPPVGGPSWLYRGSGRITASKASQAVNGLLHQLPKDWREKSARFADPELFDGAVYVQYTSISVQPAVTGGLVEVPKHNKAIVLLDYQDQVSTVSAAGARDSLIIGEAWARALGSDDASSYLEFEPSVKHGRFSPRAIRMLEAVYGRAASAGIIINVERIATQRADNSTPVRDRTARGESNDILLDSDIRRELTRGDHITSISFQFDWSYGKPSKPRHFLTRVTISSDEGPVFIKVARGNHSIELASSLYIDVRRAIAAPTKPEYARDVKQHLKAIALSAK